MSRSSVLIALLLLLIDQRHCQQYRDIVLMSSEDAGKTHLDHSKINWCPGDKEWTTKPFQPLRFKWFELSLSNFTEEGRRVIRELMNESAEDFSKLFMVRRSVQKIGIPESIVGVCNQFTTPDLFIGRKKLYDSHIRFSEHCDDQDPNGIPNADFVAYIRQDVNCSGGVLGYALACGPKSFDGRPIFGVLSLCSGSVTTDDWNRHALKRTLQHEVMHLMGFSGGGLNRATLDYYDGGVLVKGYLKTIRKWKVNAGYTRDMQVSLVASPRTRSFVRDYFSCPTLEGAEIENEGGSGTAGVHWEKRIFGVRCTLDSRQSGRVICVFQGETMSGYLSRRSYLSEATLAFFEDTKWYKTNYAKADCLNFAKGKGCIFAQASCREYMDSLGPGNFQPHAAHPYCNWADYVNNKRLKSTVRECSADLEYYSRCDFKEEKNESGIEEGKTYFADQWADIDGKRITGYNVYGSADTLDGCPQWTEEGRSSKGKRADSVCTNMHGQPMPNGNWGAELFSNESKCFKQDGKFEVYQCLPMGISQYHTEKGTHGAGCYKYKCARGRLMIQANYSTNDDAKYAYMREYKVCWGEGSFIHIRRHQFSGELGERRFHKGIIVCPNCKSICENNIRYPNFQCLPDIHLNSSDYADIPCEQGESSSAKVTQRYLLVVFVIISALVGCTY